MSFWHVTITVSLERMKILVNISDGERSLVTLKHSLRSLLIQERYFGHVLPEEDPKEDQDMLEELDFPGKVF